MCQGKMPMSVRQRYEQMAQKQPEKFIPMIENFDQAYHILAQKIYNHLSNTFSHSIIEIIIGFILMMIFLSL